MRTKLNLQQFDGAGRLWLSFAKSILLIALASAVVIAALTTALLLIPLVLAVGIALRFYIRGKLRRARPGQAGSVIDADYTVIDRKSDA